MAFFADLILGTRGLLVRRRKIEGKCRSVKALRR